jgi:hypothetical protein
MQLDADTRGRLDADTQSLTQLPGVARPCGEVQAAGAAGAAAAVVASGAAAGAAHYQGAPSTLTMHSVYARRGHCLQAALLNLPATH